MSNKNVLLSYHGVHSDHPQHGRADWILYGLLWAIILIVFTAAAWLL